MTSVTILTRNGQDGEYVVSRATTLDLKAPMGIRMQFDVFRQLSRRTWREYFFGRETPDIYSVVATAEKDQINQTLETIRRYARETGATIREMIICETGGVASIEAVVEF